MANAERAGEMMSRLNRNNSKGPESASTNNPDCNERTRKREDAGLRLRSFLFGLIACLASALPVAALEADNNHEFRGNPSSLSAASNTEDGSAGVDGASGTATVSFPIAVPPGPGGLVPTLSLSYSSAQGDGPFGLGWNLQLGEIRCTARYGVPDYANCPAYELDGQLLVGPDTRPGMEGRYHTQVESFKRIRLLGAGASAYWEVTVPGGMRLLYGESTTSKIDSDGNAPIQNGAPTARWLLSKSIDIHDNEILVTYDRSDVGVAYPSTISYASGERVVTFLYETRPDEILDFPGGIPRNITQRLHEIEIKSLDTVFSRRLLSYSTPGDYSTHRSRIVSTQLFGKGCDDPDPAANCPSMPAQTYEYTETTTGGGPFWDSSGGWGEAGIFVQTGVQTDSQDLGKRLADVNGDGLPDLVVAHCTHANAPCEGLDEGPVVYINDGSGWVENDAWTNAIGSLTYEAPTITVESAPYGFEDRRACNATTGTVTRRISFATEEFEWKPIAQSGTNESYFETYTPWPYWHLVDVNGDGLADLVTSIRGGVVYVDHDCAGNSLQSGEGPWDLNLGGAVSQKIFLNSGTGWDPAPTEMAESLPLFQAQTIVKHAQDGSSIFGGGSSDCDGAGWLGGLGSGYCTTYMDFRPQFVELNGDGLLDIIVLKPRYEEEALWLENFTGVDAWWKGEPVSTAWIQNADGSGWTPAPNFDAVVHMMYNWIEIAAFNGSGVTGGMQPYDPGVYFVDLNRDGLTDVVINDSSVLLGTGTGWCNDGGGTSSFPDCDADSTPSRYLPPIAFTEFTTDPLSGEAVSNSNSLVFIDLNGDGWVDLLQGKDEQAGTEDVMKAWLHDPSAPLDSNGNPSVWVDHSDSFKPSAPFYPGTQFADLDGNGTADILLGWFLYGGGSFTADDVYLSPGTYGDLLASVDNGRGGITDFTYVSAVVQRNAAMESEAEAHAVSLGDADGSSEVVTRFTPKPVISEQTVSGVGIAANVTTGYRFGRPRFDPVERSDLGFGLIESTRPDSSIVDAYYYQGQGLVGRPSLQNTFDQSGNQIHTSSETWVLAAAPGSIPGAMAGVDVARVSLQVSNNVYGANEFGPESSTSFTYDDSYGYNFVSQVVNTRATGRLTTTFTPDLEAYDEASWLVGLVGEKRQLAAGITQSHETYDYTQNGQIASRDRDIGLRDGTAASDLATTSWAYDSYGNVIRQTDTRGGDESDRVVEFCYDGDGGGNSWCPVLPGGTPDTHSLRVGVKDAIGGVIELEYDWVTGAVLHVERFNESGGFRDSMTVVRDAFGRSEEQWFRGASFGGGDPDVQLAAMAYHDEPSGNTPAYIERFQFIGEVGGAPIRSARYLDGFGNAFREVEETPSGYRGTAVFRDPVTQVMRSVGPIDCDLDASCSDITETTEPATEQAIDAAGRVIRITLPDGQVTRDYSWMLRVQPAGSGTGDLFDTVEITDSNDNTTRRLMDGKRIVWADECQDAGCASFDSTFYTYEAMGEISTIYDAVANATGDHASSARYLRYHFDTLGRVIQTDEPNTGSSLAEYDHQGNITKTTNVRGAPTYTDYDALGRVEAIVRPAGVGEWDLDFTYDPISRKRKTVTTPDSSYSDAWEYDDFGQVARQTRVYYDTMVMNFEYDLLGRPTKISYPSVDSSASYRYQGAYLTKVCRQDDCIRKSQLISHVQYDGLGRRVDTVAYQGTVHREYFSIADVATGRSVHGLKRLAITRGNAAGALDFNYQYDSVGNITGIDDQSTTYDASAVYTYDARNRLASWTDANDVTLWYTYDDLGNLEGNGVASQGSTNQGFDPATKPHQITVNRIGENYAYDADGNVIKRGAAHFVYDSANRLVCTGTSPGSCNGPGYRYDVDGQLLWDGSEQHQLMGELFKWQSVDSIARSNIFAFGEVIAEVKQARAQLRDPSASAPIAWPLPRPEGPLLWMLAGAGVLALIALLGWLGVGPAFSEAPATATLALVLTMLLVAPPPVWGSKRGGRGGGGGGGTVTSVRAFFRDHLGSAAYATGPNKRQAYEPFGKTILTAASTDDFTSKEYHDATDLYYFGARWYDAEAGRFAGVDPLVTQLENPQQLSAYAYVVNNPVKFTDPTGMCLASTLGAVQCSGSATYRSTRRPGISVGTVTIEDLEPAGAGSSSPQSAGTGSSSGKGGNTTYARSTYATGYEHALFIGQPASRSQGGQGNDAQRAGFSDAPDGSEAKTPGGAAANAFESGRTTLDGIAKSRAEARIMQEVAQRRVDAARAGGNSDAWAFVTEQNIVNRATGQKAFIDYTLGRNISVPHGTPVSKVPTPGSLTPLQTGIFQRTWTLRGPLFIYRAPGPGI
jgi:RHS repeat-associated protein